MSECVVRMEEPETCGKCPLSWYDGAGPCFCMVSLEMNDAVDDGMMWKEVDPNKKPSWCPVICQLPEGHGRLVDADTAVNDIRDEILEYKMDSLKGTPIPTEHLWLMKNWIDDEDICPTIVPAERSETNDIRLHT